MSTASQAFSGNIKTVAIKKIDHNGCQGTREFLVEVMTLGQTDHPNLVKLIGYCAEGDQKLLVYEYMPLSSLEEHLHDPQPIGRPLDWNTRMNIAAGAAKVLEYLHNKKNPPIIHRDLKSSNILHGNEYHQKLFDFRSVSFCKLRHYPSLVFELCALLCFVCP